MKATRVKELAPLWDAATNALTRADAIVFVGYRFPPSDVHAKQRLLAAIQRNTQTPLWLHTVLGRPGADSERLAHMLSEICANALRVPLGTAPNPTIRTFKMRVHPLFAEDFFTVAGRLDEAR